MSETTIRKKSPRLFIKVTRDNLPQIKDRYPYIYLEHGRLEVDDSSIKWIDAQGGVVRIPAALLQCLLLGPGTSVTHEAVKVLAAAKCTVMWVGEDSLLYYANGISPTADTRNMLRQLKAAADPVLSLNVARRMFARRFPSVDLGSRSLPEMMGMEGVRVRNLYRQKADQYGLRWEGRRFVPGQFSSSDTVNRILTACNAALYGILNSVVHSAGFSPYIGFIQSSPRPWRCFQKREQSRKKRHVFSTSVEVFPTSRQCAALGICLLHVRGGVSIGEGYSHHSPRSSPRPWRCF